MKRTRKSPRVKDVPENLENTAKNPAKKGNDTSKPKGKTPKIGTEINPTEQDLMPLEDPPKSDMEAKLSKERLTYDYYDSPCEDLAKSLLGKVLVRLLDDGTVLKARIIETESYLGIIDKASQTYGGKVTPRNLPMYMRPGTIFVYLTYGMYHCFNISSKEKGSSVFLRAAEPLEGIDKMKELRNKVQKSKKDFAEHELCNGPSKLCLAFDIDRTHNKYSVCTSRRLWIEDDGACENVKIVQTSRIGIDSVGTEWAKKPLRFYVLGNKSVSKRDKIAEKVFD